MRLPGLVAKTESNSTPVRKVQEAKEGSKYKAEESTSTASVGFFLFSHELGALQRTTENPTDCLMEPWSPVASEPGEDKGDRSAQF